MRKQEHETFPLTMPSIFVISVMQQGCQPDPALKFPLRCLQLVPICYFTHLINLPKKFLV